MSTFLLVVNIFMGGWMSCLIVMERSRLAVLALAMNILAVVVLSRDLAS